MTFLDMVNLRLDHVKAYNSESHYQTYSSVAKRWTNQMERSSLRSDHSSNGSRPSPQTQEGFRLHG